MDLASGEIESCDKITDSNGVGPLNEQFINDLKINDRSNSPENEEASSCLEARSLAKWCCTACTYQNWPKSSKCIMCGKNLYLVINKYNFILNYLTGTRGPRKMSPSPDNSTCEPPTIITKRVKSPEKDLAVTINTDSNNCTLKRLVYILYYIVNLRTDIAQ